VNRRNAYYLDTNIIAYYLFDKNIDDNLDNSVLKLFHNPANVFYASYVAVKEIVHLLKQERIKISKQQKNKTVLSLLNEARIEIVPVSKEHLYVYESLFYVQGHNDPNDMLIIAQAIADKIPVISSDRYFKFYEKQGLKLVFNKR
jgi:PIN domain nuclease of toxin-antitoxin system